MDSNLIQEAIDRLVRERMLVPGTIIEHAWIEEALKIDKKDPKAWRLKLRDFTQLKIRLLKELKVDLKTMPGTGYKIIDPQDQTKTALIDTGRSIGKALDKGLDRVTHVDIAKLSDTGKREQLDAIARLASLSNMSRRHTSLTPDAGLQT